MAKDKIVQKILESAQEQSEDILAKAKEQEKQIKEQSEKETTSEIKRINEQTEENIATLKKENELNTDLEKRKIDLASKQELLKEAFNLAKKNLNNLSGEKWFNLITQIVLAGTRNDTYMIKPAKKVYKNFLTAYDEYPNFLDYLNLKLKQNGLNQILSLDKKPAHFENGIMLIGKYSDVNASFDVLIENQREELEYEVSQILFGSK